MYTNTLQKTINKQFKKESFFQKAKQNFFIFKFENFSITQIQSIFNQEREPIFQETNAKKHFNKILDMIKSQFYLSQTQYYFQLLFQPTSNKEIYQQRKKLLEHVEVNSQEYKEEYNNINQLNYTIKLPFTLYTLDQNLVTYFYEKYNITILKLSTKELEREYEHFDQNTILITEESLNIEIPVYTQKEFEEILTGIIIKNNKEILKAAITIYTNNSQYIENINSLFPKGYEFTNLEELKNKLQYDKEQEFKDLSHLILNLEQEVQSINQELKDIIANKQVNLQGQELLDLLNSGDLDKLKSKLEEDTKIIIQDKEQEIIQKFKNLNLKTTSIFTTTSYPLELDEEVKEDLLNQIEIKRTQEFLNYYQSLNELKVEQLDQLLHVIHGIDLFQGLAKTNKKFQLRYPKKISDSMYLDQGRNIYLETPSPINYAIGSQELDLNNEKVSILTGANSGGKTTLLEMVLQNQILSSLGLAIPASANSTIYLPEEVIYLKKFTGTQGSGAFEQTIRALIDILDSKTTKLMLIDEFEAVTEPGAAAKILLMFLSQIKDKNTLTIAVSHLGKELQSILQERNIKDIRIDGISATGLDEKGKLVTKHQPVFYELGKSTPELIMQRILQDNKFWKEKDDHTRTIFEKLLD